MKKIHDIQKKWGDIISEKNEILEKSKNLIPYSNADKEKISSLDEKAKVAEAELITALREKYDELSGESGQVSGYSKTDFEKDLKTSYIKAIDQIQKYAN